MKILFTVIPVLLIVGIIGWVVLQVGGSVGLTPAPQDYAEANRIEASTDVMLARSAAVEARANELARAQAEAVIIKAQADADAKRASANTWAVVVALVIGLPLVILALLTLMAVRRDMQRSLPNQIHFTAIPLSNGRWKIADERGNWHILDYRNADDKRILDEVMR